MSAMAFPKTAGWLDWCPAPSKPQFKVPAGSVDAHCHVFGPGAQFPYAPERKYTPCDASKQQLYALRDTLGFARNVIVQATCHGADNRAMVDALVHSGGRARGVATVRRSVTDEDLRARVVDIQQTLDRILADTTPNAVGTSGRTESVPRATDAVTVDRARLLQMRNQLDALLAALNRR